MRVLLVEDDSASSRSIEMMLKSEGYVCDSTGLGEDGLEIGKLYDYDLIILDLMLPDLDGFDDVSDLDELSEVGFMKLTVKSKGWNLVPMITLPNPSTGVS